MSNIADIDENKPHEYGELICLKCLKRWIGVWDASWYLKDIACPYCEEMGYIINTGQTVQEDANTECKKCKHYQNDKCKLGLSSSAEYYCAYFSSC